MQEQGKPVHRQHGLLLGKKIFGTVSVSLRDTGEICTQIREEQNNTAKQSLEDSFSFKPHLFGESETESESWAEREKEREKPKTPESHCPAVTQILTE